MPKKKVGVSLRKPPRTPDVAPGGPVVASAARQSDVSELAERVDSGPVVARASGEAQAAQPASIEAFVTGAGAVLEHAARQIPPAELEELVARGPHAYRQLTLYLPERLARELSLYCLEHGLDLNGLVASAVEQHLGRAGVAAAPTGDVAARARELTVAARALLADLSVWVRAAWTARGSGGPLRPVSPAAAS